MAFRTDLALEAQQLHCRSAGEQTRLPGVMARHTKPEGVDVTDIRILDERGAGALGKPVGTYLTVELEENVCREPERFSRTVRVLAENLRRLLDGADSVLVAGLGNRTVTPDAVGPYTLQSLIVTRHLKRMEGGLAGFGTVSAMEPGVLGTTGIESAELVRAAAKRLRPDAVIAVDALAAGSPGRLLRTVQLTDTGIVPGSGVQNSRAAMNRATMGLPVVAVGVPTVVDAGGWVRQEDGQTGGKKLVLTPRDIDLQVRQIARLLGYGLNLALHPGLTAEDIPCFLP